MIEVTLKKAAKKAGITSSYQLQRSTGFDVSMAARLWKEEWTRVDLGTLDRLCSALKCKPNDILQFTSDREY